LISKQDKRYKGSDFDVTVESIARSIRELVKDIKVDSILSISYTGDVVNRYLDIELRKSGAYRTRSGILHILVLEGGTASPTLLSGRVMRSKHAITRAVDKLESDGLVYRIQSDAKDRRTRRVSITNKGLQFVKETMSERQRISHKALSCLDDKSIECLKQYLRIIRKHLLQYTVKH